MQGAPLWARFMTVAAGPFQGVITVEKVFESPYQKQL